MTDTPKFLFLDYDETLVSSLCPRNEAQADALLEEFRDEADGVKFELEDGWYISFIRPWTRKFIAICQELYGKENVGILSQGTVAYVTESMRRLDIDIPLSNVYGREDIATQYVSRFKGMNMVLVDNEDYMYHNFRSGKVRFLQHSPREKFVVVDPYYVGVTEGGNEEFEDEDVESLIERIETAFNYNEND